MRKLVLILLAIGLLAAPAFAATTGNGAPNGAHYNLNIIGVDNAKTADMTGSDRHTIFVDLGKDGTVTSRIYLTPGDFQVCDGNGFDAAYNCSAAKIASQGAVFQLPCNTNIPADITCAGGVTQAAYEVWARALGTPGGQATVTTCVEDPITLEKICSTENVLLVRSKGKSTFSNVTNQLTSLLADVDADGVLERVALFADDLGDWFWQYDNNKLRLAQLRFYLLP